MAEKKLTIRYKHQRFQADAARAVVNAFAGQPMSDGLSDHEVDQGKNRGFFKILGYGNKKIVLSDDDLCKNVRNIQTEAGLKPITSLGKLDSVGLALTIEMETGTGKTYAYIKTMYELNAKYGWTKFIVIVPSIAIREGVQKSFESMKEHFKFEYDGKQIEFFTYSSKELPRIRTFAESPGMQVMIINSQAFNSSMNEDKAEGKQVDKAARIIFSERDDFGACKPIDIIAQCHPIIVVDEPQSVLGDQTRKGIAKFNPLFTLLYSATHRKKDICNMVYRLDAIDAVQQKLVKKIEVKAVHQDETTATNSRVYVEEIIISTGDPKARITFDQKTATGVKQVSKVLSHGDNLFELSNGLEEYRDRFIIEDIIGDKDNQGNGTVKFVNGITLSEGGVPTDANEDYLRRIQIRETIYTHLERERELFKKDIKVLSLFFIDKVENYRVYGQTDGRGKYAKMFEEEYARVLSEITPEIDDEDYLKYLNDPRNAVSKVHQGYFAQDKKGTFKALEEIKSTEREQAQTDAFDLIMRRKEDLLRFDEPVRFIFSHSALKEGWDNPNVFQICALKPAEAAVRGDNTRYRQEVGRGMRLCVNQDGERQDEEVLGDAVFDTNVLTVIANEKYSVFANGLQKEIADACQDRAVIITVNLFENKKYTLADGTEGKLTTNQARDIYDELVAQRYVKKGELTEKYYNDKHDGTLDFEELNPMKDVIVSTLDKIFDPSAIRPEDARKPKVAKFQKDNFEKSEFKELWKRINKKTYYKVNFDTTDLIDKAIKAMDDLLKVTKIVIKVETGALDSLQDKESLQAGTAMTQGKTNTYDSKEAVGSGVKYDLVGKLVSATGLTRKTIVAILKGIKPVTFDMFKQNPEEFILKSGIIINDTKAMAVVEHIEYHKSDDEFSADVFTEDTLRGKLGVNAIASTKSLYDLVVLDSMGTEKTFAESLEQENDVVVYTKLPRRFYINTPMGKYNPDWAVAFREGSVKHIYFVAETKGNALEGSQLRGSEECKIECARRHFSEISDKGYIYSVVHNYSELYAAVTK